MLKKVKLSGAIFTIIITLILVISNLNKVIFDKPQDVYQIYLDGKKIGMIEDKEELFNLIDTTQMEIKEKFNVDKVYPPDGLKTVEYTTYSNNVATAQNIYNKITEESNFTIKGYIVTIKKDDNKPIYINILNKDDLEPALKGVVEAFIPAENLDSFLNNTQKEVTDIGETIQNVYFEEKVSIKEGYLNVNENIITSEDELKQYLLFGTLDKQDEYIVKDGDTVETIAYNNKLSNEELLIANPNLSSTKSLLSEGQTLNIGLINPLLTIVEEVEMIEDVTENYDTKYEYDDTIYAKDSYTKQEGVNGINRVTEQIQYKNGEIMTLVVSGTSEITPTKNKIVVKGTKKYVSSSGDNSGPVNFDPPPATGTSWTWPTSRKLITSYYGYRWGKLHAGLDISGSGFGSPIYAALPGTVIKVNKSCPNIGYYGSSCGSGYGNNVVVKTSAGYEIIYAHVKNNISVSVGDNVSQGQIIAYMGNSGSSTGTHLHFQINDSNGKSQNPCKAAFSC